MARDLAWHDLWKLAAFRKQGIFLDSTLGLIYQPNLYVNALLSLIFPGSGFCTAVYSPPSTPGNKLIGQIHFSSPGTSAQIVSLSPRDQLLHLGMSSVLSRLCKQAGEQGAVQVLAEIDRKSQAEEVFFQTGFRPYAEQTIWLFPKGLRSENRSPAWIPLTRRHSEDVSYLYNQLTPQQIQKVEPPPRMEDIQGLIAWQRGALAGYALAEFGPRAVLVDALIDPAVNNLRDHLIAVARSLPYYHTRKVYFRVRGYQQRVNTALKELNAESCREQIVVVKKLAVHYKAQQKVQMRSFEKQPDITNPISNLEID